MYFSEVWNNVPAGSTLNVKLAHTAGFGLAGSHTEERPNGSLLKGPLSLAHFPLNISIDQSEKHKVKFDILFAGTPVTINMVAEVVDPTGITFGQPAQFTGSLSADTKVLTVKLFANG